MTTSQSDLLLFIIHNFVTAIRIVMLSSSTFYTVYSLTASGFTLKDIKDLHHTVKHKSRQRLFMCLLLNMKLFQSTSDF